MYIFVDLVNRGVRGGKWFGAYCWHHNANHLLNDSGGTGQSLLLKPQCQSPPE